MIKQGYFSKRKYLIQLKSNSVPWGPGIKCWNLLTLSEEKTPRTVLFVKVFLLYIRVFAFTRDKKNQRPLLNAVEMAEKVENISHARDELAELALSIMEFRVLPEYSKYLPNAESLEWSNNVCNSTRASLQLCFPTTNFNYVNFQNALYSYAVKFRAGKWNDLPTKIE